MACVECHVPGEDGPTPRNQALARRVDAYCEDGGLLVRPYENLCILSPPLVISKADIDEMVSILGLAIGRAAEDLSRGGWI